MFYKLYLDNPAGQVIKNNQINNKAKVLFISAVFHLNKRNMLVGSPKDIQKKLNISKGDFELGIQELKRNNLVRKYSKTEYMINPELTYYGDEKVFYTLKHIWDTQTTIGIRD